MARTDAIGSVMSPPKEVRTLSCPSRKPSAVTSNSPRCASHTRATEPGGGSAAAVRFRRMKRGSLRAISLPENFTESALIASRLPACLFETNAPAARSYEPVETMSFAASSAFGSGSIEPSHGRTRTFDSVHDMFELQYVGCQLSEPPCAGSFCPGMAQSAIFLPFTKMTSFPPRLSCRMR